MSGFLTEEFMVTIKESRIFDAIKSAFIEMNYTLTDDVVSLIFKSEESEKNTTAKSVLMQMKKNLDAAKNDNFPICQDTGMAVVFLEIGNKVIIESEKSIKQIVNEAVKAAYHEGYLRLSVVSDPLKRVNTNDNTPAIVYTDIVSGEDIKIRMTAKGFGSENMSSIKMFNPSAAKEDIVDFVVDTVRNAKSRPCPPIVLGVGIGGTFDYCAVMAKKALVRDLNEENPDPFYAEMEKEILNKVNELNIGPQGFGGNTTALKVNIETFATHIAGLPVAVNINCHVCRHREVIISGK